MNNTCRVCGGPMQPDGSMCTLGHAKSLDDALEDFLDEEPLVCRTAPPQPSSCDICGTRLNANAGFCAHCGAQQLSPIDAYRAVLGDSHILLPSDPPNLAEQPGTSAVRKRPGTYALVNRTAEPKPAEADIGMRADKKKRRR